AASRRSPSAPGTSPPNSPAGTPSQTESCRGRPPPGSPPPSAGSPPEPGRAAPAGSRTAGPAPRSARRPTDRRVQLRDPSQLLSQQPPLRLTQHPAQRLGQLRDLLAQCAPRQLGQCRRVVPTGRQRFQHRPATLAQDVAGHARQLDTAVLQELLDPVALGGPLPDQ